MIKKFGNFGSYPRAARKAVGSVSAEIAVVFAHTLVRFNTSSVIP